MVVDSLVARYRELDWIICVFNRSPLITLYHVKYHVRLLEIDYTQSLNLNIEAPHDSQVRSDTRQ